MSKNILPQQEQIYPNVNVYKFKCRYIQYAHSEYKNATNWSMTDSDLSHPLNNSITSICKRPFLLKSL